MNPTELRMMWMSQYNPERVQLDDAQAFFGHPSVGLSVMDDMPQQPIMDLNNPMMSIVGGDFNSQAAAAVAALGVPPASLLAANTTNLYGYNTLQQQILQQTAAVFQNYTEMNDDDDGTVNGVSDNGLLSGDDQQQQVYGQMDDPYDDGSGTGGMNGLIPKQEIINIDDFVMMNDSNSYDEADFMAATSSDQDITQTSSIMSIPNGSDIINGTIIDENELLIPLSSLSEQHQKILNNFHSVGIGATSTSPSSTSILTNSNANNGCGNNSNSSGHVAVSSNSSGNRSQRKTRKIEPVNRPGLVLKTPIAYKGNIDPSVIPIQKDGMAVCERCGAIGVKHTFYTKSRRFCSMACARGELYSLVNNKVTGGGSGSGGAGGGQQTAATSSTSITSASAAAAVAAANHQLQQQQQQQQQVTMLENMDIRNANELLQQQLQAQVLDHNISMAAASTTTTTAAAATSTDTRTAAATTSSNLELNAEQFNNPNNIHNHTNLHNINNHNRNINSPNNLIDHSDESNAATTTTMTAAALAAAATTTSLSVTETNQHITKTVRLYQEAFPHDKIPQIPKFDRLPPPCPQIERVLSIKKRHLDASHSYDWTPRLANPDFYAAAVSCFPHAPGYEVWDNLDIDMKVEVENTDCDNQEIIQPGQVPHSFWVASILNICGYKALMRYEGFDDSSHDFWVNLCNSEVHAVGWCATRGKPLIPPKTIENKYKKWKDFLVSRLSGARTLPSSFYNRINESLHSRFRLGLNLECVDKDRISQVRLATVTKIIGKRLFLRYFDSDDGFWCHEDSPIIHPVGWATTVGHNLSAPQDYLERMLAGREAMIEVHEDDATIELFKMNFTFEEYYGSRSERFIEGMKLEAVDPLNLSSICAATVMAVLKFGYMMIRIDSYQPDASGADWFCYHEKSPCIFPIGFCAANDIPLTPPNGYDPKHFTWETYLEETGHIAASQQLFHNLIPDHGFEVGMSLECADLMDPKLVCVATVARVVGRLLKIHFDGWTEEYDQWLDCESPDIYPVGWCNLVNHKLEGPPAPNHLQPAKAAAAKTKVQKKRKKKMPNNLQPPTAVANVTATKTVKSRNCHATKLTHQKSSSSSSKMDHKASEVYHSNVYYDNSQQEVVTSIADELLDDDDDEDYEEETSLGLVHRTSGTVPSASLTSYNATGISDVSTSLVTSSMQIEKQLGATSSSSSSSSSLSSKSVSKKVSSTTNVQHSSNNRKSTKYNNTSSTNTKNIPRDTQLENNRDLLQHRHQQQQLQQQQQQQQQQQLLLQQQQQLQLQQQQTSLLTKMQQTTTITTATASSTTITATGSSTAAAATASSSSASSSSTSASAASQNNSNDLNPDSWTAYDVTQFLKANDCAMYSETFSKNKIDGKRLMQLSKDEIINLFGMKVGPALKVFELIQQLKSKINPGGKSRLNKNNKSSFL